MTHRFTKSERQRLEREYRLMTDAELRYAWTQPHCPNCRKYVKNGGGLPSWCSLCNTVRDLDSPMSDELARRPKLEAGFVWDGYLDTIFYADAGTDA